MKTKISPYQLFSLMILVPIGTAILFFLTPELKQDSWIAMLIYIIGGIILQYIYTALYYKYPDDTLITYLPKIFGKVIGNLIGAIYILYFTYLASRVLRDFTELILINVMPKMSQYIVTITILLTVAYVVFKGIEVIARGAQVEFILAIILIIINWLLLILTPNTIDMSNLKPFLEHGFIDMIKKGWPLITFPYGETIVFTMLFSSVNEPSRVRKTAYLAMVINGVILAINTIMFISVLGVYYSQISLFPLLDTLRVVKLKSFVNRFDLIIVILMIHLAFYKIGVFMYAAILGTSQMFKIKKMNYLVAPFSVIIIIASILIAKNYSQHIQIGLDFTVKYIHVPLQIVIPILALLIYFIRSKFKK